MKDRFTEGFENRLLKYSLAAGAVLLGAKNSEAQVWSTTVDTTLNANGDTLAITFNGNKKFRMRFSAGRGEPFPGTFLATRAMTFNGSSANASWIIFTASTAKTDLRPLSTGYVLKSGERFAHIQYASWINANSTQHSSNTLFRTYRGKDFFDSTKFIGVRFKTPADTGADSASWNYGWIKVHVYPHADSIKVFSYGYEETPDSSIMAGEITDVSLPVEMEAFTAENTGDAVELNWSLASEVNLAGFEIERSAASSRQSSANWVRVGYVKGNGTSTGENDYSFTDRAPLNGNSEYRLKIMNTDGSYKYSSAIEVSTVPAKFELSQNYPNPFNPTTKISYAIPKAEHVTLKVYNELGESVATLVDEEKQPGDYTATFNGSGLASGVYFYEISAGEFKQVRKLMLLK